jgi:hypothetical protein
MKKRKPEKEKKEYQLVLELLLVQLMEFHWGRGALETAKNILRTLQDVVQISCNVTAEHMERTFGM